MIKLRKKYKKIKISLMITQNKNYLLKIKKN